MANTNPAPGQNVEAFFPPVDEIQRAHFEQMLRSHAHTLAVYHKALLAEGLPEDLAGEIIVDFAGDTVGVEIEEQD